jgi:hypothetical protein
MWLLSTIFVPCRTHVSCPDDQKLSRRRKRVESGRNCLIDVVILPEILDNILVYNLKFQVIFLLSSYTLLFNSIVYLLCCFATRHASNIISV